MRPDRSLNLLLAVVLILLLYNLHLWVITTGTEGMIADISRDMLAQQNFMHPRLLGVNDFSHLPMPLWLTSLGMKLWGVNIFGARFFVQVSIVVQVIFTYRIAMRLFGSSQVGLFAGLIYLSCPLVLVCSRYLSADIFLTTFELAAIYYMLLYQLEKLPVALYGLAIAIAGGILCSGLRSLVLPTTVGAYVLIFGPRNYWLHWRHGLIALILGLGLTSFWFVHASHHVPDFWAFIHQTVWQTLFGGTPMHPRWQYVVSFGLGTLPWWFIVLPNLNGAVWQNPNVLPVCISWLALPLIIYTLTASASLAGLLPIVSGFSILVSYWQQFLTTQQVWTYSRWFAQIYGCLGMLALIVPLGYQILGQPLRATWPITITSLGTLTLVVLLYRFIRAGVRIRLVAVVLVPSFMLLLYSGYYTQANGAWKESTDVISQVIQQRQLESLPVLVYNETLPSLAFTLNKDTITIDDGIVGEPRLPAPQNWPSRWIRLDSPRDNRYLRRLMSDPSVLVISGELPARWNWVKINYPQMERVGRWQVLYRTP
ncbi:pmt family 4-amino-4-deoxy-l-arabinose transferase [Leptolyngbya sp. Heron Island J]|uniref:ArnT family glycosyltransferase n=1 Tax=Leptolyngbya sp. Heron Island J TaxID=1385935 RepID=UPI0003B9502B|nr:glycosyltransferase family 39 protein [Leptolyngbya sp. Heron Island J]ESA33432.1 pmt family 4-amino-4-deoxy-l-arabinose transferase [Leptolyngbya sp. Heron Island J]